MTKAKKRIVIVNKGKFFVFWLLATLLVNLLLNVVFAPDQTQADTAIKTQSIIVTSGDTLWSIASEYGNPNEDVRDTISRIKDMNSLKSTGLTVGQQLIVPCN